MARREIQGINAGSMSDIAFLLLIFFLVSTTMESDKGILRILPPIEEAPDTEVDVNTQNLLKVNINYKNDIRVSGISRSVDVTELRSIAKNFILGKNVKDAAGSRGADLETLNQADVPACWKYIPAGFTIAGEHIIQLKNDRGTSYEKYLQVQNELTAAYREVRDEFCQDYLGVDTYDGLLDIAQRTEIEKKIYPRKVSESDPVSQAQ